MGRDLDIGTNFSGLPAHASVGRVGSLGVPQAETQFKKSISDPLPRRANIADYPEKVRELFRYQGVLMMLERKLNALTGQKYKIVPAEGERVCISETGEVFVGLRFVEENLNQESVLAGVLAHEWGHFPTLRKKQESLDHLSWDEVYRLRREEETKADMFCGRALFRLRYDYKGLVSYLKAHDDPNEKSNKYHSVKSRERVIVESFHSESQRSGMAVRLKLSDAVYGDPIYGSRLIGA